MEYVTWNVGCESKMNTDLTRRGKGTRKVGTSLGSASQRRANLFCTYPRRMMVGGCVQKRFARLWDADPRDVQTFLVPFPHRIKTEWEFTLLARTKKSFFEQTM